MKKKLLSIVLCVAMVASLFAGFAITASATEVTAKSKDWTDGTYTLGDDDVEIDGTVTVKGNVTLNIPAGRILTINGTNGDDGFTPGDPGVPATPGKDGGAGLNITGSLTITGEGTLEVTGGKGGEGGNAYEGTDDDGAAGGNGGDGILVATGGSFTVNGATVKASGGGGSTGGFGSEYEDDEGIHSGYQGSTGSRGNGICANADATVSVSGGNLTANSTSDGEGSGKAGINSSGATLTVSGGAINATGYNGILGSLEITGGTVNATATDDKDYQADRGDKLEISGGNLTLSNKKLVLDNGATASISGGTFNFNPSAYEGVTVADGKHVQKFSDSKWFVLNTDELIVEVTAGTVEDDLNAGKNLTYKDGENKLHTSKDTIGNMFSNWMETLAKIAEDFGAESKIQYTMKLIIDEGNVTVNDVQFAD